MGEGVNMSRPVYYVYFQSSIAGVLFALYVVLGHKYKFIHDKDNETSLFKNDAVFWIASLFSVASIAVSYLCMWVRM